MSQENKYHQISSNIIKYHQISSNIIKYYQISSNIIKYHQISSNIIKYHQISSNIIKYHQISSNIIKYHQISSNIIKYHQISSNIIKYPEVFWASNVRIQQSTIARRAITYSQEQQTAAVLFVPHNKITPHPRLSLLRNPANSNTEGVWASPEAVRRAIHITKRVVSCAELVTKHCWLKG